MSKIISAGSDILSELKALNRYSAIGILATRNNLRSNGQTTQMAISFFIQQWLIILYALSCVVQETSVIFIEFGRIPPL